MAPFLSMSKTKNEKTKKSAKSSQYRDPVVGVDLGGTKVLARLVDSDTGAASGRHKQPTPKDGPASVLDAVAEVVRKVEGWEDVAAVGVGIPGPVNRRGVVAYCPNIDGWDRPIDAASELEKRLGKPVVVANDVNCGAVAEHRVGAGRGVSAMLAVFVGTGVGGGLILDDELVVGERGQVGEIGHVTVKPGGRPCGCGGFGHLETYAGRAGMIREARRLASETDEGNYLADTIREGTIKSRHIAQALDAGDPVTIRLLQDAADALALGIGNIATVNDIPLAVLGGGIVDRLGEPFLDQIRQSPDFGGLGPDFVELRLAQRLDDAGAVGAAILAADAIA